MRIVRGRIPNGSNCSASQGSVIPLPCASSPRGDPAFPHVTYAAAWPPCDAPGSSSFCSSAACCPPPLAESDEDRLAPDGDAGGGAAPKPAGKALSILVTFSISEGDIYR